MAVRSMTGFGRGTGEAGGGMFLAEVRSVNHRYLDVVVHLPRELAELESRVRRRVRSQVGRGRVEVSVIAPTGPERGRGVRVDTELAARYHKLLQDLADHLAIPFQVDARFIFGLPGVLDVYERPVDADRQWQAIDAAVSAALGALEAMRTQEGEVLADALQRSLDVVAACLQRVEDRAPLAAAEQVVRVQSRLEALVGGAVQGESRFDVMPALERADISEELVRLRSHLGQAAACLPAVGPVGRRLEFLAQEMQREWGTISAKAFDPVIAAEAVTARVAVEQMREQVQNIE